MTDTNSKIRRVRVLMDRLHRHNAEQARQIATLTDDNAAQKETLTELCALACTLIQTHGPGAGATTDNIAMVIAPKD